MKNFVTRVPSAKIEEPRNTKPGPYVDLMIDRNFKLFFGSQKRKDLLLALLQQFLPELNIVSVELGPQEHIGRDEDLVNSVFDVNCTTTDGRTIVVEAQYNARPDYLDRMLYYSTWPIDEQVHSGGSNNYFLDDVYVLSFTKFALVHDEDWDGAKVISSYSIREDSNGERMTEALHFRYVELGRFLKTEKELESVQDWWLYILKNAGSLSEELQIRLSEGGDILKRLLEAARAEGMDKKEKNEYFKNMRNAFDIKSEKWFAREDGIKVGLAEGEARGLAKGREEGEAKGRTEEKTEIVKNLKALGIDVKKISQATGLSEDAIAAL